MTRRISRRRKKHLRQYAIGKNGGPQYVSKEEWVLDWEEHVWWNLSGEFTASLEPLYEPDNE